MFAFLKNPVSLLFIATCILASCGGDSPPSSTSATITQSEVAIETPTEELQDSISIPQSQNIPDTQACVKDGSTDQLFFSDLMHEIEPTFYTMDSYKFSSIYQYIAEDNFAIEEISVSISASYSDLLENFHENPFYPLGSQSYENSHVLVRDLKNDSVTETITTAKGIWVRSDVDNNWVYLDNLTPANMINFAEMFSPDLVTFLVAGGGTLAPGIRVEEVAMTKNEILHDREVLHRCWLSEPDSRQYLVHYANFYSYLSDIEVHLWTSANDTEMEQLLIRGKHIGDQLCDSCPAVIHDESMDFVFWMEIFDKEEEIEVNPPSDSEISFITSQMTKPASDGQKNTYNFLPLPDQATFIGVYGEMEDAQPASREFIWPAYTFSGAVMDSFAIPSWWQLSEDQRPVYESDLTLSEVFAFYLENMGDLGWTLINNSIQINPSTYYLFYEQDGLLLSVILEKNIGGGTRISAILPPSDDLINDIQNGWSRIDTSNSGLAGDQVQAIAFDSDGGAWFGTSENGASYLHGEEWTSNTTKTSGIIEDDVISIAITDSNRVWFGLGEGGISIFDGSTWTSFTEEDYGLDREVTHIAHDGQGQTWIIVGRGSLSVFNGSYWTTHDREYPVLALAIDDQDVLWIGTVGGGIYSYDGSSWTEILEPVTEPNHYSNADIDILMFDNSGLLWVVDGSSLRTFDGLKWTTIDDQNFSLGNSINGLVADEQNRIWFATFGGGLYLLDSNLALTNYAPLNAEIPIHSPDTLAIDGDGKLWIGFGWNSRDIKGVSIFSPPES